MAIIGALSTTTTVTLTLAYCPQFLIIGNTYSGTFNINALSVSVGGVSTIDISGEDCINSIAGIESHPSSEDGKLMMAVQLADGQLSDQPTLIRVTGTGSAGTESIYGVSRRVGTRPFFWSNFTITATSSQSFQGFEHLLIGNNANVADVSVNFVSGFSDKYEAVELPVLFRDVYASADDSLMDNNAGFAWLPNDTGDVGSADIYSNSSGTVTCAICRY